LIAFWYENLPPGIHRLAKPTGASGCCSSMGWNVVYVKFCNMSEA